MKGTHPIGVAERRSGLSAHVIRVWEKRYGAVSPDRSEGNQRLYSDDDIEKLVMLAKAVKSGESIRRIAGLSAKELSNVLESEKKQEPSFSATFSNDEFLGKSIPAALERIAAVDQIGLRKTLWEWLYSNGVDLFIERLIPELMHQIGSMWGEGSLRIYQEHTASESIRSFLGEVFDKIRTTCESRVVISATPPGEMHDMGALLCAIAASREGFDVIHLGSNVPFTEIAHLANKRKAVAILLSFVMKSFEPQLADELQNFGEMIGPETRVFVGGRAAEWYAEQIHGPRVEYEPSLAGLRTILDEGHIENV